MEMIKLGKKEHMVTNKMGKCIAVFSTEEIAFDFCKENEDTEIDNVNFPDENAPEKGDEKDD